jgi:hypothetical protein
MSHSRTTLNAPFYEWIDEVRRAFRKEKELLDKLEYYNVKFIGYKGINYGQIITNPMPRNDKDMLYWLDKIDETERKLLSIRKLLMQYEKFIETLSDKEKFILRNKCESLKENENQKEKKQLSKSLQYKSVNQIIRQWYQFLRLS